MLLQTTIPINNLPKPINYQSQIISIGSCFAEHMAQRLQNYQFRGEINPFGILFHSKAIARLMQYACKGTEIDTEQILFHNDIWSSFEAHSSLNSYTEEELQDKLQTAIQRLRKAVQSATHCIITLGTSWVYKHKSTGKIVANCHKIAQKEFEKILLSPSENFESLERIENYLREENPTIQVVYTVSPVRHIKDGFLENQRSKSHIITALHHFLEKYPQYNYYFPSYELMMDELRDYRFYTKDLVHPNELAIDYIWEKFVTHCIDNQCLPTMKKVLEVQKGLAHRPFNTNTDAYHNFLDQLATKIDVLLEEYPFMKFR